MANLGSSTHLRTTSQWHNSKLHPINIQKMYKTLYGVEPTELHSVNFVRQCCVVVEVIGKTITALKLESVKNWKQLWTNAITRRQILFRH